MEGSQPPSVGRRRESIVAAVGIGVASSAVGYWVAPVTICADVAAPAGQYCGLSWWLFWSHPIVAIGGVLAGSLLGLATRVWIAAAVGIVLGNFLGQVLGLWVATLADGHAAIFGDPPRIQSPVFWAALFSVVGTLSFSVGWAMGGWGRRSVLAIRARSQRTDRG